MTKAQANRKPKGRRVRALPLSGADFKKGVAKAANPDQRFIIRLSHDDSPVAAVPLSHAPLPATPLEGEPKRRKKHKPARGTAAAAPKLPRKTAGKSRAKAQRQSDAIQAREREQAERRKVAAIRSSEHRLRRKLAAIDTFVANMRDTPFTGLIEVWKKHVGYLAHIRATGVNKARAEPYEYLLGKIEQEWARRAKIPINSKDYFPWPTTTASPGRGDTGSLDWVAEGVLSYMGYHVGENASLKPETRWLILSRVFSGHLPPVDSPSYIKEWGKPGSPQRLKKMAESIAAFTRSAKRRKSARLGVAITEWENDLSDLRQQFYVKKFGFGWPLT